MTALRQKVRRFISLVAEEFGAIVGNILFTPVIVDSGNSRSSALGLAPPAVLPAMQRRGIGGALVRAGLDTCRGLGHLLVFVLGEPSYYTRFGFAPTRPRGIAWEHDCPPEAFMFVELAPGALADRRGTVRFAPEFDAV